MALLTVLPMDLIIEHDEPLTDDFLQFIRRTLTERLTGLAIASTAGPSVTVKPVVADYTV